MMKGRERVSGAAEEEGTCVHFNTENTRQRTPSNTVKGYMALEQIFVSARTIKRHHHRFCRSARPSVSLCACLCVREKVCVCVSMITSTHTNTHAHTHTHTHTHTHRVLGATQKGGFQRRGRSAEPALLIVSLLSLFLTASSS
jgi:hypothetical protein